MYSFPSMNEQRQQAGAALHATSYYTQNTLRNQQAGNESNSCQYNTVNFGHQQPRESNVILPNGGYRQMSFWQIQAVSHQQMTEVKNCYLQAPRANGEKVLPNSQMENTGFPTSHGVPAHRSYGNINQGFTNSASAYTTTTSASCDQTTHGSTVTTATPYNMQASQNNQFKQIDARHGSYPNVFRSNLATSQRGSNDDNAMYWANGQNLPSSNAHQNTQQHPAVLRPAYNYGGSGSNATNQYVLHKSNEFNDTSSHLVDNKLQMPSSRFANGSGHNGPPPPYHASGYSVQQSVKSHVPNVCVSRDNSGLYLQERFKSNNLKGALRNPPKNARTTLISLLTGKATGAQRIKAKKASPSADNKISKQNRAVSFSNSSQMTTPINRNQSPRHLSDTFQMTETPLPVKPSDCSAYTAAPGTKVIAVVQPLPCESFQACSNSTSPDTDKGCISPVAKIAAWLREEGASFPDATCGVKSSRSITTTGGGSKDGSDLSDLSSSPQSSVQESQLDNEKRDAQKSVPSPTLESTKSPKDQEVKKMSSPAAPNAFVLRENDVFTEQPYKSSWLNVNEQLDDIDKEFGFPWSLKCQYYKHQSDDESDGETSVLVTAGAESETSNRIVSQTQFSPAQTAEEGKASSPKSDYDGATESCYSFKLDVLPPEVAKHIFEQAGSLVMLSIGMANDACSRESKLEDDAPDAKTMENPSASHGTKKTQKPIKLIDLTTNDQSAEIIISDDDEDIFIVETETHTKMPEPDLNIPAPEEMSAAPVQINAMESPNNLTKRENDNQAGCEQSLVKSAEVNEPHLDFQGPENDPEDQSSIESFEIQKSEDQSSIESIEIQKSDDQSSIESFEIQKSEDQSSIKSFEIQKSEDQSSIESFEIQKSEDQSSIESIEIQKSEDQRNIESIEIQKSEDQSSIESIEIQKSEKCKQSDVDSRHAVERISKRDETFVDAPAAGPSRPKRQAVQLVLYGSAQKKGYVYEPPMFLSVFLSPLKRKGTEDVCIVNKPVKQRILEKWRESLQPAKIQRRKKSAAKSLKMGDLPGSSKKTGMMDQTDGLLKRRKVVKKNPKKYAVTVKDMGDCGKREPKNENQHPSAIPENVVLKFTVLPDTFDFKDRSEMMAGTPAAMSAGRELSVKKPGPVEGKRQSHSDAVNKAKATWNMNHSKLLSQPAFPKKSDLFQEFKKKHKKKNFCRLQVKNMTDVTPSCLFSGK